MDGGDLIAIAFLGSLVFLFGYWAVDATRRHRRRGPDPSEPPGAAPDRAEPSALRSTVTTVSNALVVGGILLILYMFVGHGYVRFLFGGKAEMLQAAAEVNRLCNTDGSCPVSLPGWREQEHGPASLRKDVMLYLVTPGGGGDGKEHQAFRLVYTFFLPDHWFEARGGVGREVTSGWESN